MKNIICKECGKTFRNIRLRTFCSKKCAIQNHWKEKRALSENIKITCINCNKDFFIKDYLYKNRVKHLNNPKFCGNNCYIDYIQKNKKIKTSQAKPRFVRLCNVCGIEFSSVSTLTCSSCRGKQARSKRETTFKYNDTERELIKKLKGIMDRCYYEKNNSYKNYGAKGIVVCDEWKSNSKSFINWSLNNGYKKGLHIDRIDNKKGYSPDNCQYVTQKENNRKKDTKKYIYKDRLLSLGEIAEIKGISYKRLWTLVKDREKNLHVKASVTVSSLF